MAKAKSTIFEKMLGLFPEMRIFLKNLASLVIIPEELFKIKKFQKSPRNRLWKSVNWNTDILTMVVKTLGRVV